MGKIMDFLTGRKATERKETRDRLSLQADIAIDEVVAQAFELREKRAALDNLVEELKERRRGRNA